MQVYDVISSFDKCEIGQNQKWVPNDWSKPKFDDGFEFPIVILVLGNGKSPNDSILKNCINTRTIQCGWIGCAAGLEQQVWSSKFGARKDTSPAQNVVQLEQLHEFLSDWALVSAIRREIKFGIG